MPIISKVGQKSFRIRLLIASIYLLLLGGAVTMIYPFMIMVSGSVKSETDVFELNPLPRFVYNDLWLYRKYIEAKYNVNIDNLKWAHHTDYFSWRKADMPAGYNDEQLLKDFLAFRQKAELPDTWQYLGHFRDRNNKFLMSNARLFLKELRKKYDDDLDSLNRELNASYESWSHILMPVENLISRRYRPSSDDAFHSMVVRFKMSRPKHERFFVDLDSQFRALLVYPRHTKDIDKYNETHGTHCDSYDEVLLTERAPDNEAQRTDWEMFVREELNLNFIHIDQDQATAYGQYLKEKYLGRIERLNEAYGTSYAEFAEVPFSTSAPEQSIELVDWELFLKEHARLESVSIEGPRQHFEAFVAERRGVSPYHVSGLNMGQLARDVDLYDFEQHKGDFKIECIYRNYYHVLNYILLHGRGVMNTVIYCGLAILTALLVNPLAAYALSRFQLPSTYKILLFCMATMAFPAEVTMIPSFLLLKKLGLLNTFAALVLPGAANGFSIFLLKGFFDSLPRDLYEAADLDGAGEWTKFWTITMSLSKPILAVIALQAFNLAYSNFMFALIIIPDQKMWTLMVWLYQLQQTTHQSVTYAALIIAAVPTFTVFLFCQNIIMRGIVVPVEK